MREFPKELRTKVDITNTFEMVKAGELQAEDWLAVIEKLENQNWITCPLVTMSEDRKTVTLNYCAEAAAEQKIKNGSSTPTIMAVEHVLEVLTEEEIAAGKTASFKTTVLTLSKALLVSTTEIGIPAADTYYNRMEITEAEVAAMKGELA